MKNRLELEKALTVAEADAARLWRALDLLMADRHSPDGRSPDGSVGWVIGPMTAGAGSRIELALQALKAHADRFGFTDTDQIAQEGRRLAQAESAMMDVAQRRADNREDAWRNDVECAECGHLPAGLVDSCSCCAAAALACSHPEDRSGHEDGIAASRETKARGHDRLFD